MVSITNRIFHNRLEFEKHGETLTLNLSQQNNIQRDKAYIKFSRSLIVGFNGRFSALATLLLCLLSLTGT